MFTNTEYFSPVVKYGITGAHPKSVEYQLWWKEQRDRCLNGYSVAGTKITGDYYWYLNFWKIRGTKKRGGRKTLISPRFLDMDLEYFDALDQCRIQGKHMCVVKRRQSGFSEKHASIMGREFSLFPHSQTVITAGEEKYSNATMRMVLRGLNSLNDTEFYKRRNPDKLEFIQSRYKVIVNGTPEWRGYQSEVYNRTSHNNPQATIGLSPSLIYFEEGGKFPGLIESFKYIQPALEAEGVATGLAIIVGTGGDMEKGAADLEEIFYNPDAYNMISYKNNYDVGGEPTGYFVPGWKYFIIDRDGNSDKDASTKKILENRERARKSTKANAFITEITQMPLIPDEAFMRTGGNMFNQAKLNEQFARIKNNKKLRAMPDLGRLRWVKNELGVITDAEFYNDDDGDVLIMEHPERDENKEVFLNLYKAGTDSYDRDSAETSSSEGSCSIIKTFRNAEATSRMFVARYTGRPPEANEFYETTAKLCMYYKAPNLIEWSNILIFDWYKRNGFEGYLKLRPMIAYSNTKDSKASNRYGIDPSTKDFWMLSYRDYIEKNVENMFDLVQIEKAIKFRKDPKYNCDITISSSLAIVHMLDDIDIQIKKVDKKPKNDFLYYKSSKHGNFERGFEKSIEKEKPVANAIA